MLRQLRAWVYRSGRRPKPGAVLYSPSLDLLYGFRDHPITFTPPERKP